MNAKALSVTLVSLLAFASSHTRIFAADPNANPTVEAADRQFLAALESGDPAPAASSSGSVQVPQPVMTAAPVVRKEIPATKVATAAPKKPVVAAKHEAARTPEVVEVRRALPVTVTTTSTTYQASVDRDDDDDHDHDRDDNEDHSNGFFHRLFRGEKIFR